MVVSTFIKQNNDTAATKAAANNKLRVDMIAAVAQAVAYEYHAEH